MSSSVVDELQEPAKLELLREWFQSNQVTPFTINGFPFGNFHDTVVKQNVYLPTWAEPARLEYTWELAKLHHQLLPDESISTISTLPLGWPVTPDSNLVTIQESIQNLLILAQRLSQFESETGREVVVCIEPEPGCLLDTAEDLIFFFDRLFHAAGNEESIIRRHIGICHDVCHSAVMFEAQREAFQAYQTAGLRVGKIQVSSAIESDFDSMNQDQVRAAVEQLKLFAEPKFLHQTTCKISEESTFFNDLPIALETYENHTADSTAWKGCWRVHYHVPIYLSSLGALGTTQVEIKHCLDAIEEFQIDVEHFELETYAWNELPASLQEQRLADGIAKEIQWWKSNFQQNIPKPSSQFRN